jgi:[pyruvate, water dikinase]-phosphate phosphotransferase / [pyruvate, water dikinase] kinase
MSKFTIFALSDATGELAHSAAVAAVNQFPDQRCDVERVVRITDKVKLEEHMLRAKEAQGVVLFTFVSQEMRLEAIKLARQNGLVAIDILGPSLDALTDYLGCPPSPEPGLQYKMTQNYYRRTEAVEFTVKHDDGLAMDSIDRADIILLGISRTSKTPLSIYLAYQGYRCANVPLVKGIPVPPPVLEIARSKLVGLTLEPNRLSKIRSTRLKKLGRADDESYASVAHIRDEIQYAQELFTKLKLPVLDVTGKAIEETASDIIAMLGL